MMNQLLTMRRDADTGARKTIGGAVIRTRKSYPAGGSCGIQNAADGIGYCRIDSLDHAVAHLHMVVTAREMAVLYTVGGGGCSEARSVWKCRASKCKHRAGKEEEQTDYEHLDKGWKSGGCMGLNCISSLCTEGRSAYIVHILTLSLLTKEHHRGI